MIPGALGRCDAGHVFLYGIGAFFLTMAIMAKHRPRLFPIYAIVFFAVFGLALRIAGYAAYAEHLGPVLSALMSEPAARSQDSSALAVELGLDRFDSVAAPLGCDPDTRRYLIDTGRIAREYHPDLISVRTPAEVERKVQDLQKAKAVLAPRWVLVFQNLRDEEYEQLVWKQHTESDRMTSHSLGLLFLRPIKFVSIKSPLLPALMVARHLARHFEVIGGNKDYVLLAYRKQGSAGNPQTFPVNP